MKPLLIRVTDACAEAAALGRAPSLLRLSQADRDAMDAECRARFGCAYTPTGAVYLGLPFDPTSGPSVLVCEDGEPIAVGSA